MLSWSADIGSFATILSDADGRFVNVSGDTMTGALTIKRVSGTYQNLLTVSGGRMVIKTTAPNNAVDLLDVSGGSLKVSGNINATGTILSVGSISTRGDLTLNIDQSAADTILTFGSDSTNETLKFLNNEDRFEFSDDVRITGGLYASGALIIGGAGSVKGDFTVNSDQTAADTVLTFGSDSTNETLKFLNNEDRFEFSDDVRITGGTFASGALIVDGAAIFKSTLRLNGVTYTFPTSDGTSSGKVLKTNAAGALSWSTDLNTGALSYADAQSYFVDDTGDTMTGSLTVMASIISRDGFQFESGAYLGEMSGFNENINLLHSGLGTKSVSRLTVEGDLVNIGSIQAGEAHLRRGGTFAAKVDYTTGTNPRSVAIGELNGDRKPDIVVANQGTNTISVFIGTGAGVFVSKVDYTTGSIPFFVAIGDLNGDGKPDITVANNSSTSVSVFLNKGNGTFASKVDYTTGSSPTSVAIGDLNGDGKADLAVANFNDNSLVSVLLNNGNGTFAAQVDYTTGGSPAFCCHWRPQRRRKA